MPPPFQSLRVESDKALKSVDMYYKQANKENRKPAFIMEEKY